MTSSAILLAYALQSILSPMTINSEFIDGHSPVVSLKYRVDGQEKQGRFIVDTGAEYNILLLSPNEKPKRQPEHVKIVDVDGKVREYEFLTGNRTPNPSLTCYMQLHHVDGVLGCDWFLNHDIQIDYKERSVRVTPPGKAASLLGNLDDSQYDVLHIVYMSGRYRLPAVINSELLIFPVLGSGSSISMMPGSHVKPTVGASEIVRSTWNRDIKGKPGKVSIALSPGNRVREITGISVDSDEFLLAGSDLGDKVIYSFHQSKIYVQK